MATVAYLGTTGQATILDEHTAPSLGERGFNTPGAG